MKLVVKIPFDDRAIGDEITDAAEVEKTLAERSHFVTRVETKDKPERAPAPPAVKKIKIEE